MARNLTARVSAYLLLLVAAFWPARGFAQRATTTVATVTPAAAQAGQQAQITALVRYTGTVEAGFPTGTVAFTSGGAAIPGCTGQPLTNGSAPGNADATCNTTFSQAGSFSIAASYGGDANSGSSSGSATLVVMSPTTVALAASAGSVSGLQVGQTLTLTATVANSGNLPLTGTVDFTNNGSAIAVCTGRPLSGSAASCYTSVAQVGTFTIGANYNGDADNNPSSGSMQLTIGKVYATPSISAYVSGVSYHGQYYLSQAVTVDATFEQAASVPTPAGTVKFYDGSALLAAVTVVQVAGGGYAKIVAPSTGIPSFSVGTHSLTAVYSGDGNYQTSTTPVSTITIAKTPTTPYIAADPSGYDSSGNAVPLIFGQPLFLGAAFPPPPGSVVLPTGTVTFYDGTAAIASVAIDSATGYAGLPSPSGSFPLLTVGTHLYSAVYGGDAIYQQSNTSTLPGITVIKATVSLVLASTPFQAGQPVTIDAIPIVSSPGIVAAAGTLSFGNGSAPIAGCTGVAVESGAAQCTTTLAQAATVNVSYSGDAGTAASSSTLTLSAGKATAGIYVESATTNPVLGQEVTVDVRVDGPLGFPAPTGAVTFTDTSASNAALGLASVGPDGHALMVLPPGTLALGPHVILAGYGGDANYGPCTALPVSITVGPAPTVLVVASPAAQIGQPVTLSAAVAVVSPGVATLNGTVYFGDGGASCQLAPQNATAQCSATIAKLDTLSPAVSYVPGDGNTAGSTIAAQPLPSGTALAGIFLNSNSPNPPFSAPAIVTAVLVGAPGVAAPTGAITFTDNGASLSAVPVPSNGQATLTAPSASLAALAPGDHEIAARYSGDANYQPGAVPALNLVVTTAVTKMDLGAFNPASASAPPQTGQPVTLKAAVTILGPGTAAQGGTVDFSNGSNPIAGCTGVPLESGAAQCITAFAQAGAYTINAGYSGWTNTTAVTASMQLTVGKAVAGFFIAAYSAALPYGAGVGISGLLMGTPMPTGTVTFSDGATTLATVAVSAAGTAPLAIPSSSLAPLGVGSHTITGVYSGDGNYQAATAPALNVIISQASTSVALASTPPQIDQAVTLKAAVTVVSPGVATPSGTVDFSNGSTPIAGCTGLALASGVVFCTTTFTQLGAYTISARYNGDAHTAASTANMPLNAGRAVAGIYTASAPAAPVFGVPVTVTALLLGASGVAAPTGTVSFYDGSGLAGIAPVGANGRASLTLASGAMAVGTHTFSASYSGDANYASASAAALAVPVGKASTTTALAASFGAPFTATVSVLAPGVGAPTGTVQFTVGGAPAGTAPLVLKNGVSTASLAAGPWSGSAWAIYLGDANFAGSGSATVAVAPAAVVSIASDHNPATVGQPVNFTVTVTPASGIVAPGGQVQLSADGAGLGSAPLVSGNASFAAGGTALSAGSHTITASYSGDSTYPAASATFLQVVTKSIVSLALTSSLANGVYGQPVTFTAQISAPGAGGDPSGTVQFSDGSAAIGAASLSSGAATLTLANLAAGTHSVSAIWAGAAGASAASSAPLSLTIGKARTATSLASSGLTLAATVTAIAPGAGTPTGTAIFLDASTNSVFATVALTAGTAAAAEAATADPIVAAYSGDANFAASLSAALSPLAAVNAASFASDSFAPDEIVTLFGSSLSAASVTAASNPLASLGGTSVSVTDSAGVRRAAALLFVSPSQANMVMPLDTAAGSSVIALTNAAGGAFATAVAVMPVAPGLFTRDGSGAGLPVGQVIRAHADGSQDAPQDITAAPIDLGASTDTVYLVLYGTGIRHQSTATATFACATCAAGAVPLAFAGAQPSISGLDQVNLPAPSSLRGAGPVTLTLLIDNARSNPVTLAFQ